MDILFLDIDGVLRTYTSDKEWSKILNEPVPLSVFHRRFSVESISALNYICHLTKCKIVISSTWRTAHSLEKIRSLFRENRFSGEILDFTTIGLDRGEEILEWVDTHNVNKFVVIDDNIKDIQRHISNKHIIKIDSNIGLNDSHVEKIIDILL